MDLTNTLVAAVQLVPAPLLVDYVRITTGSGVILQTLFGEELWGYLAMSSDNKRMTGYQYITNTAPTTFQSAGNIAAGAMVTYNIPLLLSFLVQPPPMRWARVQFLVDAELFKARIFFLFIWLPKIKRMCVQMGV